MSRPAGLGAEGNEIVTKPGDLNVERQLPQRLAEGSQDSHDYRNLADHLVTLGRVDDAVSVYEQMLNMHQGIVPKARVATELGWLFYETGKFDRAQALAESALSQLSGEEDNPEVLLLRGLSQSLAAHCIWYKDETTGAQLAHTALHWLEIVMTNFPEFQEVTAVYYTAARLHSLLGDSKETIILCQKLLQHQLTQMDRLSYLTIYGEALRLDERLDEAERTLEQAIGYSDKVTLPRLYFELGLVRRHMNRTTDARKSFKQALEALHTHPYLRDDVHFLHEVSWNLAEVCYELGEYADAAAAFQQVRTYLPENDPNHWNALLWVGYCYQALGERTNARECYREVLESSYSSAIDRSYARKGLGEIYYELEEYEEAALAFETFLISHPEDDAYHRDALLWLGCCYEVKGADGKARDCFDRVLASPYVSETGRASAREGLARLPQVTKKTML